MRQRSRGRIAGQSWIRNLLASGLLLAAVAGASPARATEYDPKKAGNPLKIVYYAAYPACLAIDWLILRPAFFIGQYEPFHTLFGTTRHPEIPDPPAPEQSAP